MRSTRTPRQHRFLCYRFLMLPFSLTAYAVSVVAFFAIDMLWIGVFASSFYRTHLGYLLGPVQWPVAIAFYLLFLVGLQLFAIAPALEAGSVARAVLLGALFGFFAYSTYDLTNWATVKDWPAIVSLVDICWGTAVSAAISGISCWAALHLFAQ